MAFAYGDPFPIWRQRDGIDHALKCSQEDNVPHIRMSGENDGGERKRLHHRQSLCNLEYAVPVPSIDPHSGKRGDEKRRQLPGKTDEAEKPGGIRQPVDQPARRHLGHPGTD